DGEREVPWRDDAAHAPGLVAVDVRLARRREDRRAGTEAQGLAAVVLAEVDRLAHVGVGLRDRLPGLEHLERGQLGAPAPHDRRRPEEDGGPAGPRRGAPGGPPPRPGREGATGPPRPGPPAPACAPGGPA